MTSLLAIQDEFKRIYSLTREMTAVALARISLSGRVKEANLGFANIMDTTLDDIENMDVRRKFINPEFDTIAAVLPLDSFLVYQGLVTFGDPLVTARSLQASIFRKHDDLWLVGEHNIQEMESLAATVIELNEELSQVQRTLVRQNRDLKRKETEIRRLMLTDTLTGLPNRRHFEQRVEEECQKSDVFGTQLCLALCDIDRFKAVNDTFGHHVGDEVLRTVAQVIQKTTHEQHFAARWGGEEFILLYVDVGQEDVFDVTERVREAIANTFFDSLSRNVTASLGVTALETYRDFELSLRKADEALYDAKNSGRNQVKVNW